MLSRIFRETENAVVNRRRQIDTLKIFNDKYVGNDLIQTAFFSFFSDFLEVA
jgi:hypothetical protein